jgi:hypothetical protein
VPSSKVGSCDSASAAAERDSGVDAGAAGFAAVACAGFAGVACAGFATPAGADVAGLTGGGAVPAPAGAGLWPNAGAVASIVAMARIVILRMSDALGR